MICLRPSLGPSLIREEEKKKRNKKSSSPLVHDVGQAERPDVFSHTNRVPVAPPNLRARGGIASIVSSVHVSASRSIASFQLPLQARRPTVKSRCIINVHLSRRTIMHVSELKDTVEFHRLRFEGSAKGILQWIGFPVAQLSPVIRWP